MNGNILVDTNIIINDLRLKKFDLTKSIESNQLFLSAISVSELYSGESSKYGKLLLEGMIETFNVISMNHDIARMAGEIRRDNKGQNISLADSIIAATAIKHNLILYTLNKKHFINIPGVELL
jgi:predicted nucleic acid-binding protein